jgi:hypothetical protein
MGWVAVAVMADSVAAAVATILWLALHFVLLQEVVRVSPTTKRPIAYATALSLIAMAVAAATGAVLGDTATALGITIVVASAAYSLPALVWGMISKSTAGLSLISLSVNAVEGAIYFAAGVGLGGIAPNGHSIKAYVGFGGVALVSNVPRLVRTSLRRLSGEDERVCQASANGTRTFKPS